MKPSQLAKASEHSHQVALFAWCAIAYKFGFGVANAMDKGEVPPANEPVPALEWIHAIHNQGHGDAVRGAHAKAEGVRSGVADIFLPWPVYPNASQITCGLYIELKTPDKKPKVNGKGGLSDEQISFGKYANSVGYCWKVCYGWREAADMIEKYLKGEL